MVKKSQKFYASALATTLVTAGIVAPVAAEGETGGTETGGTEVTVQATPTNNVGKKDEVLVKAVPAGATVKIYLKENDTVPAFSKKQGSKAGDMKAVLAYDLPTVEEKGNIYISITEANATTEGDKHPVEYTAEPQTDDLTTGVEVLNNVIKKDAVVITLDTVAAKGATGTSIQEGATVKVYAVEDEEKAALLGSGRIAVKKGEKSISTVSLKAALELAEGEDTGNLIVTVANPGQAESDGLTVEYSKEVTSSFTTGEDDEQTTAEIIAENNVKKKDGIKVTGLPTDKVATIKLYSKNPDDLDEAAKKAALLGTAKSKKVSIPATTEGGTATEDGQAVIALKSKNGFADLFETFGEDSKVYVTIQYTEEHESAAKEIVVADEKQTDFTVAQGEGATVSTATEDSPATLVVETVNNVKGKDTVTVKGAEVGAEISIYAPDAVAGDKPLAKAKVKAKAEDADYTATVLSLPKGFSENEYADDATTAKYKLTVQNADEKVSEQKEFTASNAEATKINLEDNVVIENNVTTKDTLKVTGLAAKTIVNVYKVNEESADDVETFKTLTAAEQKKLLIGKATAKVVTGETGDALATIAKGFDNTTEEGKVFVEIIEPNKISQIELVDVAAEADSEIADAKITVTNSLKKDFIEITGLTAKDTVKVYAEVDEDGKPVEKSLLGKTTVKAADATAKVSLKKNFATKDTALEEEEVFYVTVQNDNKAPILIGAETVENKKEAELSAEVTEIVVPVETTTAKVEDVTFTPIKVNAKSFGFEVALTKEEGATVATPFAEKDTVKIYTSADATKPVKTFKVSAANVTAEKVASAFNIDLSDNEETSFWYTVTNDDAHESEKVEATAQFALTTLSEDPITGQDGTDENGKVTLEIATPKAGDTVKLYLGTKVVKTVKAVASEDAGQAKIILTGIKEDTDYAVTVTTANHAESEKADITVVGPKKEDEKTEPAA
ncbi:hypothetical protein [Caryophanon tenue]|uniref:Uncharacterized protein n=1 Tax=Caryophanon tenue TaxID=33978 RepID=A0A1C0YJT1_9BACL|nr:hypothetical protein [Caryophanon tenue]OCS87436.1 hypothetical protein A6M13_08950 [Caryophanon tenue]